ncbi:MAG: murein L,D-transpeptidase family protein [Gammaproteobacteria bacterium]
MGLSSRLWNAMLWVALGAAAFAAPVASVASVATAASASTTPSFDSRTARLRDSDLPIATHVVVHKAERRLEIFQGDEQMREFRIALGGDPTGHKLFEGDSRTPEGRYMLGARNARSEFFLSMHVSYPNAADTARARKMGRRPGGLIMVHGQPNEPKRSARYYESEDWTDGCIALSNADMMEFWLLVPSNTPIDIRP